MHKQEEMLFSFTVFPIGSGDDLTEPVADAVRIIADSDLDYQVTGSCTLLEGKWTDVVPVLEKCMHVLTEKHNRVYANITVDHHAGSSNRLKKSVTDVEGVLDQSVRSTP